MEAGNQQGKYRGYKGEENIQDGEDLSDEQKKILNGSWTFSLPHIIHLYLFSVALLFILL